MGLNATMHTALNVILFLAAMAYAVWREKIDIKGLAKSVIGKFIR